MKKRILALITLFVIAFSATAAMAAGNVELTMYMSGENLSVFSISNVKWRGDTDWTVGRTGGYKIPVYCCELPVKLTRTKGDCVSLHKVYGENGVYEVGGEIATSWFEDGDAQSTAITLNKPGIYYVWGGVLGPADRAEAFIVIDGALPTPHRIANPTKASVFIDGKKVDFEAYNVEDSNYFKLRDIAKALSGTTKQFNVGYDAQSKAVTLTTKTPYTEVGGELMPGDGAQKYAMTTQGSLIKDGRTQYAEKYNIGGNNYFAIRSLCYILDVKVEWDTETKSILIDTQKGHFD